MRHLLAGGESGAHRSHVTIKAGSVAELDMFCVARAAYLIQIDYH